jgi:hypothetical protein
MNTKMCGEVVKKSGRFEVVEQKLTETSGDAWLTPICAYFNLNKTPGNFDKSTVISPPISKKK